MMKLSFAKKSFFTVQLTLMFLAVIGTAHGAISTEVVLNKSALMNLKDPAVRVSLANPAIADVILISPKQVQINGTSVGETSLIVWEKGSDKPAFFDLKVVGNYSVIDEQIREMAPNDAINVQYAHDTVILSGNTASEKRKERAEQIAKVYSPKVINNISVNEPQQVLLQVKVAQVDKTALKKLGVSVLIKGQTAEGFTNLVGAPSVATTTTTSGGATTVTSSSGTPGINGSGPGLGSFNPLDTFQMGVSYFPAGIGAVIQALNTKNLAKVLAEPNLLVKSKEKGEFLAGSKVPYPIITSTGGSTTPSIYFVDVGVKLNFMPEVMENGLILLKIDPAEVSSIVGTSSVSGYPIIDIRNVKTNVELRDGESLILAGLLQEETIKVMSKIPILGDIPILGALFRSTSDDIREKDLVFFITPKLIKPAAPGEKLQLPTDKALTPEEEKEMQWVPMGS